MEMNVNAVAHPGVAIDLQALWEFKVALAGHEAAGASSWRPAGDFFQPG